MPFSFCSPWLARRLDLSAEKMCMAPDGEAPRRSPARHSPHNPTRPRKSRRKTAKPSGPDLSKYDFAFPSSTVAAERILQPSPGRPAITGKKYAVFSSPMAIATYQPIVNLLSASGLAKQVNGVWYFDVRKYVDLVKAGWRWTNIRGNATYPVNKRILITTADPRTSNSAAMFLSIVSYVANHNTVVQSEADEKKVLPLVARLFVNQGYTDNSSEGPFDDYLALGMGKSPMVNIYEAQFVDAAAQKKLKPGMVLMYPPTYGTLERLLDGVSKSYR